VHKEFRELKHNYREKHGEGEHKGLKRKEKKSAQKYSKGKATQQRQGGRTGAGSHRRV
jgi:hypothetical protein